MKSIISGVVIILSLCSLKTAAQSKQTGGLEEVKKVIAAANAIISACLPNMTGLY